MAVAKGPVQTYEDSTGPWGLWWGHRSDAGRSLGGLARGIRRLQGTIMQEDTQIGTSHITGPVPVEVSTQALRVCTVTFGHLQRHRELPVKDSAVQAALAPDLPLPVVRSCGSTTKAL